MSAPFKLWANGKKENARPGRVLPSGEEPGTSKVPFKLYDKDSYVKATAGHKIRTMLEDAPVQRIPIRQLASLKGSVSDYRVYQHAQGGVYREGHRAPGTGALVDKPVVVKVGGQYILHDGTHRAVAAHLRGDYRIEARVIDLDGPQVQARMQIPHAPEESS